jgi:hypothetical protein
MIMKAYWRCRNRAALAAVAPLTLGKCKECNILSCIILLSR